MRWGWTRWSCDGAITMPRRRGADDAPEERISGKMKGEVLDTADLAGRGAVKVETGKGQAKRFGGAHSPVPSEDHGNTTPYGMEVEDFILGAMTERLVDSADVTARKAAVSEWNAANDILKRGIAVTPVKFGISFTLTHLNQAGALVHVYQDGSVHMNHGGTEMGQGLFQKVAQVAADRFGLGLDRVKITATDTGKVPNTSATAASSGSDLNGMAVKVACDEIRARIAGVVAPELQAEPAQLVFEDGMVRAGAAAMSFEEAVQKTYMARVSLSATGFYKDTQDRVGPHRRTRAPFLLFRLWRGLFRGGDRHADRGKPHPAHRYPA